MVYSICITDKGGRLQNLAATMSSRRLLTAMEAEFLLRSLGIRLKDRYERTGILHDLQVAIALIAAAVRVTPHGHPNRAGLLHILGEIFARRYERTGNPQNLQAAIVRLAAAVEAIPLYHPHRVVLLGELGNHLSSRYDRTGNLRDLKAPSTDQR